MNSFKKLMDEQQFLKETNFEFTKVFISELKDMISKAKKGTYRFNEIVELKKRLKDLKAVL